jgi:hypothetical protein
VKHRSASSKSAGRVVVGLLSDYRSISRLSLDIAVILLKVGRHATLAEDQNLSLVPGRLRMFSCNDVQDEEAKEKTEKDTNVAVTSQYRSCKGEVLHTAIC